MDEIETMIGEKIWNKANKKKLSFRSTLKRVCYLRLKER